MIGVTRGKRVLAIQFLWLAAFAAGVGFCPAIPAQAAAPLPEEGQVLDYLVTVNGKKTLSASVSGVAGGLPSGQAFVCVFEGFHP